MGRKKKTIENRPPTGPQEYQQWKVGDYVYCNREPDDKPGYGRITNIHLKDKSGIPCFTFCCEICGQFRLAFFSKIVEKPTTKMKSALKKKKK